MRNAPLSAALLLVLSSLAAASPAYDQGAAEAKADLARKEGYIYSYGLRAACNLDQETGLPVKAIASCIVSTEILDRAKGYNDTTAAWIKANGLPANSRKKWLTELRDLHKIWSTTPGAFVPAEAAVKSAEKPYAVSIGPKPEQPDLIALKVITDNGETSLTFMGTRAEALWGPAGSKTLIVRTTHNAEVRYHLIDLQRGLVLDTQWKPDPGAGQT